MCRHGETMPVRVKIPADLSYNGRARWKLVDIDRCIAPIVAALQESGIDMRSSCCGHGGGGGYIELQDGRTLAVHERDGSEERNVEVYQE